MGFVGFGVWVVGWLFGGRCAALRLPERSGGSRKAALRELHERLVVQRRMRSLVVVPLPMLFAEHFGFQHRGKGFPVQELVPKPAA